MEIDIADDGPGLDAEQLARVFRPFERLGTEHGAVGGTGLGLALSHQLMHAMGGELRVASQPGQGTVFTMVLRAADQR